MTRFPNEWMPDPPPKARGIARRRFCVCASTLLLTPVIAGLRRALPSDHLAIGGVAAFFLFQHGLDLGDFRLLRHH